MDSSDTDDDIISNGTLVIASALYQRRQVNVRKLKDDKQTFLQKVSKKQFRTVYYNANACG